MVHAIIKRIDDKGIERDLYLETEFLADAIMLTKAVLFTPFTKKSILKVKVENRWCDIIEFKEK